MAHTKLYPIYYHEVYDITSVDASENVQIYKQRMLFALQCYNKSKHNFFQPYQRLSV